MGKHLQLKYSLLHIFFWLCYCCIFGYVAVFLRYEGLSNTLIGLTTGIGCALTIVSTPALTGLVGNVRGLTIRSMLFLTNLIIVGLWAAMIFLSLPQPVLMLLYIAMINVVATDVPLLTTICMNYLTEGASINFGLSRGLGSVSYATTAVVLGILIEHINPTVLGYVFAISAVLLLLTLFSMPSAEAKEGAHTQEKISMFSFIGTYRIYMVVLLGFSLMFAGASALGTYLINLVEHLGGTTSLYGVGVFCMAASELPFMAVTPMLKQKTSTENLLLFAGIMYVARNVIICIAPTIPVMFFGMALQGLSYGIFTASITYYVHERIALEHGMQGQTMIAVMTSGVGATIGNIAGGMLQDNLGLPAMLVFCEMMSAAGLFVVVLVMYHENKKEKQKRRV